MTVFASTDLPASINTVEKLAAWVGLLLNNLNQQTTVQEVAGLAQPVAVSQLFEYDANGVKKWRLVIRISLEVSPNWQTGATKLWTHIQNLAATAIPTDFKS